MDSLCWKTICLYVIHGDEAKEGIEEESEMIAMLIKP